MDEPAQNLSWTGARWVARAGDRARERRLTAAGLHPVVARCLANRPELGADDTDDWLHPSVEHLHPPSAMLGMDAATERLERAIRDRQRVRIITDYDVDGTTSSLILQAALRMRGLDGVDYHIPDRFDEGYGFSAAAADRAADDGVALIVTADIGVRDHAAVARARERGLDVLICDHHLPDGASVPTDALVLCPPQPDCRYPNPHLAACGVSLKLAQGLLRDDRRYEPALRSMLKLAAIGTVADMVPLVTRENRAIVALGLAELNGSQHAPGLSALLEVAGLTPGHITERDLGFRVGPRINAAGRIASARLVVKLLTSRDPIEARALARQLDELNAHRRQVQLRMVRRALEAVPSDPPPFVLVAADEGDDWHRGVAGIVASRLKDDLNRPTAVVALSGDTGVASVRCPPSVHAVRALDSVADLLVKYGGHPAAAGFTVPRDRLAELARRLVDYVDREVGPHALTPEHAFDVEIAVDALSEALHADLARLGPFGMGNPEPRLAIRGVIPKRVSVRASGRLLHLALDGPTRVEAVWWGAGDRGGQFDGPVDILGSLGEHHWNGARSLQLQVTDIRRSVSG
jgi:single-stranded-DNA-specific exonuclease